jgi:hypothetical protein
VAAAVRSTTAEQAYGDPAARERLRRAAERLGRPCTYTVIATDGGPDGRGDAFTIDVSGFGPDGGPVRPGRGDVLVRAGA